ncbi:MULTISPECIES: hypothetical protein [unclassified Myroides]|uniref:hypothetical protein n=1 Tax=unclassified Myroides TaxID=2642485 RepID=UPI0015FE0D62|nr:MULTISPECIES: hypothetical protein [unclassified Myroides]MBB1151384.1 hypothetical protein [Myroides sp. NP-2]MDM1409045.1 hypothetical protein [Myroides sp. DF42-4-2]
MIRKNLYATVALIALCTMSITTNAQSQSFGQKIGELLYEMTTKNPDTLKIQNLLKTMDIDDKEVKIGNLSYSIFDGFDGDRMYYIPFTKADESRFTVEQLKRDDQLYFGVQFLLSSTYTLNSQNQVNYSNPTYAYNVNLDEVSQYCTTPMKYKNGSGNNPESPLLSCIYTNPDSKKRMMYWVVFEQPTGNQKGNTIKEIKFQSIELWQK